MAHRADQRHRHSAVAADRRIDPRSPWRNHQRDDPRRLDHCGRRSGRRCDHRHREHLATSASKTRRRKHSVPCRNHPGRLARGQGRHRLRDLDGDRRARPGVLPGEPVGRVLPAACAVLHDRHPCLDGRRPHGHTGARLSSSAQRAAPGSLQSGRAVATKGISGCPFTDHCTPEIRICGSRRRGAARPLDRAAARPRAPARVQGARFPDALADQAGHLAAGNGPHHQPGQCRVARRAGGPQFRRSYRSGTALR